MIGLKGVLNASIHKINTTLQCPKCELDLSNLFGGVLTGGYHVKPRTTFGLMGG